MITDSLQGTENMASKGQKTTPVRVTDEAMKWARIASGYTGEAVSEYVSRVITERGKDDVDRLHAQVKGEKTPRSKGGTKP